MTQIRTESKNWCAPLNTSHDRKRWSNRWSQRERRKLRNLFRMMGARPLWDERRAPDETTEIDELLRSGPAPDAHDPRRCHEPAS